MNGLNQLDTYLEKAKKKTDSRQLGLFGAQPAKKKAVVEIGKRGGRIVGRDSKGNPIYEGSAKAKKLQAKQAKEKAKPKPSGKVKQAKPNTQADIREKIFQSIEAGAGRLPMWPEISKVCISPRSSGPWRV
jgi:hypothetical protein